MRTLPRTTFLLASALLAAPLTASFAHARPSGADKVMMMADPDKDGTIDLKEATTAATATFTKLEKDNDGTVDTKELKGRVSRKDLKAADPDSDGTLDEKEYAALVEARFKAADPDNDGTVDAKELKSPAGRALGALLK